MAVEFFVVCATLVATIVAFDTSDGRWVCSLHTSNLVLKRMIWEN